MRGAEGVAELPSDVTRLGERHRPSSNPVGKRWPLDQLQYERAHVVRFRDTEDGPNVWMIQGRQDPRFALEARHPIWIEGECRGQDLEGHVARERRVAGAIDLTHGSSPQGLNNLERAEASAGRQHDLVRVGLVRRFSYDRRR